MKKFVFAIALIISLMLTACNFINLRNNDPTENPTENPTGNPTENPAENPTENPTGNSTENPTENTDESSNSIPAKKLDLNLFPLSSSKQSTTGLIKAYTNVLKVKSVVDFKVGQGIAIEKLERVSDMSDGSEQYTWFCAEITGIDEVNKEISINRLPRFGDSDLSVERIVKHDNFYVFNRIAEYCQTGNKHIVFPKGVYEINAVWVDSKGAGDVSSFDVPDSWRALTPGYENFGFNGYNWYVAMPLSDADNVTLDFSNSKILMNADIHRSADYLNMGDLGCSRTRPMTFIHMCLASNITIKNLDIDGGGMQATKSFVAESQAYAIEMRGVTNCRIINMKASHFVTDAILIAKSDEVKGIKGSTCRNIYIDGLVADRCGRSNMSVCNVQGLTVKNSKFMNAGYLGEYGMHAPGCGIDFELEKPDSEEAGNFLCDIYFDNVIFYNNFTDSINFYEFYVTKDQTKLPKIDNILFNRILSYQPNGKSHFNFWATAQNLCDVTIKNSDFIGKYNENLTDSEKFNNILYGYNKKREIKFENCNFLGPIYFQLNQPKTQFNGCNFLPEVECRLIVELDDNYTDTATKSVNFNGCFFYNMECKLNYVMPGLSYNECTIYTETRESLIVTSSKEKENLYFIFKNTKLIGNASYGISEGYDNELKFLYYTFYSNKKITSCIVNERRTKLTHVEDVPQSEVIAAEKKRKSLKIALLKKIKDNGFVAYDNP